MFLGFVKREDLREAFIKPYKKEKYNFIKKINFILSNNVYDVCMMMMTSNNAGKTSNGKKSSVWFSRVVTTDTTNKDPRPEDPRRGTGEGGVLSSLQATC